MNIAYRENCLWKPRETNFFYLCLKEKVKFNVENKSTVESDNSAKIIGLL